MISIVIPTFNSERTIKRTLESARYVQTVQKKVQILVMDGASTDRTRDICESFGDSIDFYSEIDEGVYDAMNKSIAKANNDWVLFLGSDDILLPSCIEAFQFLVDPDCTYYGDVILTRDGRRYGGAFSPLRLSLANMCHQSIFYSKRTLLRHGYDLKYKLMADYDLNLRMRSTGAVTAYIQVLVAEYNNVTGMSTTRLDGEFGRNKARLICGYFGASFAIKYLLVAIAINKIGRRIPLLKRQFLRV